MLRLQLPCRELSQYSRIGPHNYVISIKNIMLRTPCPMIPSKSTKTTSRSSKNSWEKVRWRYECQETEKMAFHLLISILIPITLLILASSRERMGALMTMMKAIMRENRTICHSSSGSSLTVRAKVIYFGRCLWPFAALSPLICMLS